MEKPIIGQEAICPDGLGRVASFEVHGGRLSNIKVKTYIRDRSCNWAYSNVELIEVRK